MRYYCILSRMSTIKMRDNKGAGKDVERPEHLYIAGRNIKRYSHSGNTLAAS
jgi:hypothetical protein